MKNSILAVRLFFACLFVVCTVQMWLWPVIRKGPLDWWQIEELAALGLIVGYLPFWLILNGVNDARFWLAAVLWYGGVLYILWRLAPRAARIVAKVGMRTVFDFAIVALVVGVTLQYAAAVWSNAARPKIGRTIDYPSPDGSWVATLEAVDAYETYGQGFNGFLLDEIHLRRAGERIGDHGDYANSAVFYVDAMARAKFRPQVSWADPTHLVIRYSSPTGAGIEPGKVTRKFHGISITYDIDTGRRSE